MRFITIVLLFIFSTSPIFSQKLVREKKKGKWGFVINSQPKKKVVIPYQFDEVYRFENGLCAVKKGKYWGYIDRDGNEFLPFEFDVANTFYDRIAIVKKDGKYGLVHVENKIIVQPSLDTIIKTIPHYIFIQKEKYGAIDTLGKQVLEPIYEKIKGGYKGYLIVQKEGGTFKYENGEMTPANSAELIYQNPDETPAFQGCEGEFNDPKALKKCSEEKMLTFIYTNIKYPAIAREDGISGMVVAGFEIDKTGKIKDLEIVRPIGGGCEEEVIRIINKMPAWIPGKENGETVRTRYYLPVRFRLE